MLAFYGVANCPAGVIIIEIYYTTNYLAVVVFLFFFVLFLHKIIIGSSCS